MPIKLYLQKVELPRLKNILNFWVSTNSKVFISPEGLEFKHNKGVGSVSKEFFVNYDVQGKKHLQLPQDKKQMANFIKSFKEVEIKNGQRNLIEIGFWRVGRFTQSPYRQCRKIYRYIIITQKNYYLQL